MRMFLTALLSFYFAIGYGQFNGQRNTSAVGQRTTKKPEDQKFLNQQIIKMLGKAGKGDGITGIDSTKPYDFTNEFQLHLDTKEVDYYETRRDMDERGDAVALLFIEYIGRYFPQYERLTLSCPALGGREVKITYHFFPDNSINFYNETQGRWVKKYYKPYWSPGGKG